MVLLALAGLLAMHGITATTASAAVSCGQAPTPAVGDSGAHATSHASQHDHGPATRGSAPVDGPAIATVQGASLSGVLPGTDHAGMLCLAVLAVALLLGLRRTGWTRQPALSTLGSRPVLVARSPRAPPDDAQSVLCRWRT
jgi:hypothetical protein